jgi:hypothetical protein
MKITILRLTILIVTAVLAGCGPGSDAEPDTKALLTSGQWKMKTVTVDGVDKSSAFTNFTISFSATAFTSANGSPVWPLSGTWAFTDKEQKSVKRNDDVVVTIHDITESQLTLSLTWTKNTLGAGRIESVAGGYVFTLIK